jgi:muramoyltetrapeptide carboxypeptidase LdcA involved in peptidoglycan recycling
VGVISPSFGLAGRFLRRTTRGLNELQRRGLLAHLGEHALRNDGQRAGSPRERAADINTMFADEKINALISTVGGEGALETLDLLDYELIAARPKLLVGYSDTCALLCGLHARTGLVSIHGPALLPQLGEPGGCDAFTWEAFSRVAMRPSPAGRIPFPFRRILPQGDWGNDDAKREVIICDGPQGLRLGSARGALVVANGVTLLSLAGTPYWPRLNGALLLLEESDTEELEGIKRNLIELLRLGTFERIAGLAFGRLANPTYEADEPALRRHLDEVVPGDIPIVTGMAFGHADPIVSLPLGVDARLTVTATRSDLELLSPAVAGRRITRG